MPLLLGKLAQRMRTMRRFLTWGFVTLILVAVGCLSRPASHLIKVAERDVDQRERPAAGRWR
jgi:hypothetical protein